MKTPPDDRPAHGPHGIGDESDSRTPRLSGEKLIFLHRTRTAGRTPSSHRDRSRSETPVTIYGTEQLATFARQLRQATNSFLIALEAIVSSESRVASQFSPSAEATRTWDDLYALLCEVTSALTLAPKADECGGSQTPEPLTSENAHIMVVDDDPLVRTVLSQALRLHGYSVIEASDGRAALQYLDEPNAPLDLALVDLCLPDLSGHDLIRQLRLRSPLLHLIAITGGPVDERHTVPPAEYHILRKPCDIRRLLSEIDSALRKREVRR